MKSLRGLVTATALIALSGFASGLTVHASPAHGQSPPSPTAVPSPHGAAKICLDVSTNDGLTEAFANRLRGAIAQSGDFTLALRPDACDLELDVPGNLLRFETAGGVMVSTVVIVTSPSGHYLSASITACRANELEPCAARAVAVAKLALLAMSNSGA
jgi:hypothetical protein